MATSGERAPRSSRAGMPRHRTFSEADKRLLAVMTVAAGVLGILSPGAPTGYALVDAIYRVAFVAAMALAGSRARRWSLVVGSAVATVSSIGLGLLFGAVALAMTVLLVARQIRNRIFGACVGVFIAMACLRLNVGWFFGVETIIAAIASGSVLISGYRFSTPRTRRIVRWSVAGFVAIAGIGVVLAGVLALRSVDDITDAVAATSRGVSRTHAGKTREAASAFSSASELFGRVADDSSAWYWFPTRLVPVLSQNVRSLPVVSEAGRSLTEAAASTTEKVDYDRLRRDGGGVDLALLETYREPVLDLSRRLHRATDDVAGVRSPWMVSLLERRLDEFDTKASGIQREADIAALAVVHGPSMFGADQARHYLVLLGNPAEARDLGGHIGNFAELTLDGGKISLERAGLPLEVTQPALDAAVEESGLAPPSMLRMRPATFPQNWGTAVDFPTDAAVAARLYGNAVGREIDGVLYADPFAMAAFLSITGPVSVPELNRSIGPNDAVKFFTLDQYSAFAQQSVGDQAGTEFIRTMFERLTTTKLPSPARLGELFGPLVKQGRFRMASLHAGDHDLLGALGLDVGFEPSAGDDLLAVITRNAGPSKIDTFLHRSTDVQVTWDPTTGAVRSAVEVTLANDAPASGLPEYVIGNTSGAPLGTNVSDLAVITPFEAVRATVDGVDAPVAPLRDGDVWRHTVRVEVPPGGRTTVRIELEGDVRVGDDYRLRYAGQPLVNTGEVQITVSVPKGHEFVDGTGIEVDGPVATAKLTDVGRADVTLQAPRSR